MPAITATLNTPIARAEVGAEANINVNVVAGSATRTSHNNVDRVFDAGHGTADYYDNGMENLHKKLDDSVEPLKDADREIEPQALRGLVALGASAGRALSGVGHLLIFPFRVMGNFAQATWNSIGAGAEAAKHAVGIKDETPEAPPAQ